MNGATALPFARMISPPKTSSTSISGSSQNFFRAVMYAQSSVRKDTVRRCYPANGLMSIPPLPRAVTTVGNFQARPVVYLVG